ncbi:hypothetical protein LY78DRAFT_663743 [Colletotrichum sublineola]|nr:hypothetical protein LY78DRAFT_663743 [Colletotrichum sublineola]
MRRNGEDVAKADQVCRKLLYYLPPIKDLERVQDGFAKTDTGLPFIHPPANRLSKEYLNLCNRACVGTLRLWLDMMVLNKSD